MLCWGGFCEIAKKFDSHNPVDYIDVIYGSSCFLDLKKWDLIILFFSGIKAGLISSIMLIMMGLYSKKKN